MADSPTPGWEFAAGAPLQLDLTAIIRARGGKFVPRFLLKGLERVVCQERLNSLLAAAWPCEGSAFSDAILRELSVELDVQGLDSLPAGRFIFASNHPLGGLDGIALVKVLGEKYGDQRLRVLVNDLLMNVRPLKGVFLPINKYGRQGRVAAKAINAAYASDAQIVMFPAGLVSRIGSNGDIRDLEWQKGFVAKALEYDRPIVPVRFDALNGMRFYRTALWRRRLHIGVNLEQALLPSELCRTQGKRFGIRFGRPIDPAGLRSISADPRKIAAAIRRKVYEL